MPTIQIREIPTDAYEVIRRRAKADGKSIQAYMRERVIDMADTPSKAEALDLIEAVLEQYGDGESTPDEIGELIRAGRRE